MSFFYVASENRVTQLETDLYASWETSGNPKANYYQPIPDPPEIGYAFDGTEWVAPPPYAPAAITPRQARLQLLAEGLLTQVETIMSAQSEAARIEWEYAIQIERHNPLMLQMMIALGKSDADVDAFFVAADAL